MLSIRKLMSVVKDVDLEAMPSFIFVNDDDDDDDDDEGGVKCELRVCEVVKCEVRCEVSMRGAG